MIYHVLGWLTVTADVVGAVGLAGYLYRVGTRPWSWQQRLPVPKVAKIAQIDGDVFDVTGLY